jgi:hypothetical protein
MILLNHMTIRWPGISETIAAISSYNGTCMVIHILRVILSHSWTLWIFQPVSLAKASHYEIVKIVGRILHLEAFVLGFRLNR